MPISKILVANRSEIAIRVFRAANELGLKTVAIWAEEDKYSLHRFKADESYQVGRGPHLAKDMGPIESYLSIDEVLRVAQAVGRRRDPSRLRAVVGKPGIRRGLRGRRHHLHRPEARDDAPARQQGGGAQPRHRGRRAGGAGDRAAARRPRRGQGDGGGDRLSGDAQGVLGRRRPRHAGDPRGSRSRARGDGRQARGQGRLRQGRGLSREADRARPPRRGAGARRHARQRGAPVRARLLDPAPQPEGRRARAGALSRRRAARRAVRPCAEARQGDRLCRRRHGRVPAWTPTAASSTSSRSIRASRSSTR